GRTEIEIQPAADGVAQGVRLLVDLLEHEVLETAFFRRLGVEPELGDLAGDRNAIEVADLHLVRLDPGDGVVREVDHLAGVGDDRGRVGGDDRFPIPHADDDGAATAGGDDAARLRGGNGGDAEGSLYLVERVADGLEEVALVAISD